jgi:hypothetical protein
MEEKKGPGQPMVELELSADAPKLELEALPVSRGKAYEGPSPPIESLPLAPVDAPQPRTRAVGNARAYAPSSSAAAPVVSFYSPVFFWLMFAVGAVVAVLGATHLPFIGIRSPFFGTRTSILFLLVGGTLIGGALRYKRTKGEASLEGTSWRKMRMVAFVITAVVVVAGIVLRTPSHAGDGEPAEEEDGPGLYQPSFRRAWVEQLRVTYRDATVEVVATEPGGDPQATGATLRFFTADCSQPFVESIAKEEGTRLLLRKAGLRVVACMGTEPGNLPRFESRVW